MVKLLFDHGIVPTNINPYGGTPLHDATTSGTAVTVQLLPLDELEVQEADWLGDTTPLHRAARAEIFRTVMHS
jgi:hypothetical protein